MLCRLCLKHSKTVFNLINSDLKCAELSAIESLYWIFGVEVDVKDPYSKYICEKCCHIVEYIGTYRGLYQRNQLILQGKLDYRREVEEWSEENTKENEPSSTILNTPPQTQISPRPKRRRVKLIKYCGSPIKNKSSSRTEQAKEMKSNPTENNLILISEEIEVKVCKYCSKVCSTKQQLDIHLNTKHKQQLVAKLVGKRKRKLRYTKIKNRSRTKFSKVDSSGIAGGENSNKVSELATVGKRRKSLSLDPKILDSAKQLDVLYNNHVNVTENEKKLVINNKDSTEISSETQTLKTISLGGFPNGKQNIKTLNCKYKWLHLKDFHIPVARCAVSTKFYRNLASGLQKIDSSGFNIERKGSVKKISNTHTWMENISATLVALQQVARNESAEQRLHNSKGPVVVRNKSSGTSFRNNIKNVEKNLYMEYSDGTGSDKITSYNQVSDKDATDEQILNNSMKELVRDENVNTPNSTVSIEDRVNQSEREKFKNNQRPNQNLEKHQITSKSCGNTSEIDRRTSAVEALSDSSEDSQENLNVVQEKLKLDKKTAPRQNADKIAEKVQMKKMHKLEEKECSKLKVGNSEADLMENCDTEGASYSIKTEGNQRINQHSGTSTTKLIEHSASRKNLSAKKKISEGGTGYGYKENIINDNKIEPSERRIKVVPTKNCNDKSERNGGDSCVVSTNITADINDDMSSESETEGLHGFDDTDSDDENIPAEIVEVVASSPCSVKDLTITNSAGSNSSSSGTNTVFVLKDSSDMNLKDCIVSIERCAMPDTLIQPSKELEDVVEVLDEGAEAEKEQVTTQSLCKETNPSKASNRRTTRKDHVILSINDSGLEDKNGVLPNKMVTKSNRKKAQSSETLNTEIIDCTNRRQGILEYTSDEIKKNSETCPKNGTVVTVNINRGYGSLNLKDFNIYKERCVVPQGRIRCNENEEIKLDFKQNGDVLTVTEEDSRNCELEDVHDDAQSQDPLSEDEKCINDDDSLKNLGEPLQIPSTENTAFVGNSQQYSLQSLNDRYKWLNLKDFSIYIERCEIPEANHRNTSTANDDATITESQYREVHLRGNADHYELDIEFGDGNCEGDETGEEISNDFCLHSKSQQNKMIELKDLTNWQKQIEQAIQLVRSVRDNASNQHKSKITNMKSIEKNEDVSTAFTSDSNILKAGNNTNVDYQENSVEITSNIAESCIEPQCFEDNTVAKNQSVTADSTDVDIEERHTETIEADTLPDATENHSTDAKTITISENVLKYEPSGENSDTMTEIQKRKKHISETLQKIKRIKEVQEKLKNSKVYQMVTEQSISVPSTDTTLARGYSTKAVSDVEKDANATIEIEQCKDNPSNPEACSQSETCNAKKKTSKRKLKNGTAKHTCLLHGSNDVISKFICSTDVRVPSTDNIMEDLASSQRQVPEKGENRVHCAKSVGKSSKSRKKHRESVSTDETKRLTRDVEQLSKLLQLLKLMGSHKTATEVEELHVPVADSRKETSDVINYQPNLQIQDNENDDTEPQEQDRQDLETNSNDGDLEQGATFEQSSNCSNTADTQLVINIVTETEALVTESTERQCVSGTSHQYSSSCETSECSLEKDDLSIPLLDVDQIREDCLPSQLN